MKILIFTLLVLFTDSALALECGQTESSTSTEEYQVEVTTNTPKFLEGATITLTKADGSKKVLKAEDYMVVKRKHNRSVIKETTKEMSLACKSVPGAVKEERKNILSLKAVDGYSDVQKEQTAKAVSLKVERQLGVGVQYQRAVTERVYLGVGADTNRGAEVMAGWGF